MIAEMAKIYSISSQITLSRALNVIECVERTHPSRSGGTEGSFFFDYFQRKIFEFDILDSAKS